MGGNDQSREGLAFNHWLKHSAGTAEDLEEDLRNAFMAGIEWMRKVVQRGDQAQKLNRLTKTQLVKLVLKHATAEGLTWELGGPQLWSKDELIGWILQQQYPEVTS